MIVAKKSYYSNNYAMNDNYAYDYEKYNSYDEKKKKVNVPNHNKNNKIKAKKRIKLIAMVVLMFCVGIAIVGRYAFIMNLNNQCFALKNKISVNQKENENLKLQLMKFYDIKQIEKDATTKLNMYRPDKLNTVYINSLAINNQSQIAVQDNESKKISIMNKIIDFLKSIKGA